MLRSIHYSRLFKERDRKQLGTFSGVGHVVEIAEGRFLTFFKSLLDHFNLIACVFKARNVLLKASLYYIKKYTKNKLIHFGPIVGFDPSTIFRALPSGF